MTEAEAFVENFLELNKFVFKPVVLKSILLQPQKLFRLHPSKFATSSYKFVLN